MRKISFEQAKAQYPHRYTVDHVPSWARKQCDNGKFYAPQYASDREWYEKTTFPGEPGLHGNNKHCESRAPSWPLGEWLDQPFQRAA